MTPNDFPDTAAYLAYVQECEEAMPEFNEKNLQSHTEYTDDDNGLRFHVYYGWRNSGHHVSPIFTVKNDHTSDIPDCYWCHPAGYWDEFKSEAKAETRFWEELEYSRTEYEDLFFGGCLGLTREEFDYSKAGHP